MRALKLTFALAGLLVLVQYFPVYCSSLEFDDFVKHEVQRTRLTGPLKRALLDKAKVHSLPVKEDNISVTSSDGVFRVAVDYRVPVSFYVFQYDLAFHTVASGLTAK